MRIIVVLLCIVLILSLTLQPVTASEKSLITNNKTEVTRDGTYINTSVSNDSGLIEKRAKIVMIESDGAVIHEEHLYENKTINMQEVFDSSVNKEKVHISIVRYNRKYFESERYPNFLLNNDSMLGWARFNTTSINYTSPPLINSIDVINTIRNVSDNRLKEVSGSICNNLDYSVLNNSIYGEHVSEISNRIKAVEYTSSILNKNIGTSFNTDFVRDAYEYGNGVVKYAPVFGSAETVYQESCSYYNNSSEENRRDFLVSVGVLALDVSMVQAQAGYRIAYSATNGLHKISKFTGISRKVSYVCKGCYAAALSRIHWSIRGETGEALNYSLSRMNEINKTELKGKFSKYKNITENSTIKSPDY
jgi:hypothetical protein